MPQCSFQNILPDESRVPPVTVTLRTPERSTKGLACCDVLPWDGSGQSGPSGHALLELGATTVASGCSSTTLLLQVMSQGPVRYFPCPK